MNKEKVLVVVGDNPFGRLHSSRYYGKFGDYEIRYRKMRFPKDFEKCEEIVSTFLRDNSDKDVILFLDVTAHLVVALIHMASFYGNHDSPIGGHNAAKIGFLTNEDDLVFI